LPTGPLIGAFTISIAASSFRVRKIEKPVDSGNSLGYHPSEGSNNPARSRASRERKWMKKTCEKSARYPFSNY